MGEAKQRRATGKTTSEQRRPLGRLGIPIHTGTARVVLDAPEGREQFFWWASENGNLSLEEAAKLPLHGPFDTKAEADDAALRAVIGPDCEVIEGGRWDPAWEKPQ
jgi:hypothetical protein